MPQEHANASAIFGEAGPNAVRREHYKSDLIAEITDWVANRRQRQADYMRPDEIGAANGRAFLLQRALVDGTAYIHRERIGAEERGGNYVTGVYLVDTVFSDNTSGCSTASASRVGSLLGINERSVRRARDLLVENRVLGRKREQGIQDRHWPIVSRGLADQAANVIWWLDATSEAVKRGRPRKNPGPDAVRPFSENPGPAAVQGLEKTPDPEWKTPARMRSDDLSTLDLKEDEEEQRVAARPSISAEQVAGLHGAMEVWAPDPQRLNTSFTQDYTRSHLRELAAILSVEHAPEVVTEAVGLAMLEMRGRAFGKAAQKGKRTPTSFFSYFDKVVQSKLREAEAAADERRKRAACAEIQVAKEREVAETGVKAFGEACEKGQAARDKINSDKVQAAERMRDDGPSRRSRNAGAIHDAFADLASDWSH